MIKEISIVGTGNLAYHFVKMISGVDGLNINEIIGRKPKLSGVPTQKPLGFLLTLILV